MHCFWKWVAGCLMLYDREPKSCLQKTPTPVEALYYSPVGKLGDNFVDNSAEARFKVA
jgi:hypothetical protein